MKSIRLSELTCWLAIAATFAVTILFYADLPDPVPTHFNVSGEADGWTPKPWGAFLMPLATIFSYLLLSVLPRISPKNFSMKDFASSYQIIKLSLVVFMAFASITSLAWALGYKIVPTSGIVMALGALFIIIGNYMTKVRRNFFFGIRTPWTLANDEVWLRTHRVGGPAFVLCGILMIVFGALNAGPIWIISTVSIMSLGLVGYSYWLYRQLEGFD